MSKFNTMLSPLDGQGQTVAIGAASVGSTALPNNISGVRLVSTVDCWVSFNGPAAANTSTFLPAYAREYFPASKGTVVSVIQASAAGSLYVMPVA